MKRNKRILFFILVSFVFGILLTSCNFPIKFTGSTDENTPQLENNISSQQVNEKTTELPQVDSSPSQTPTPKPNPLLPITGSVLRWIDLSDFVFVPSGEFYMGEDTAASSNYTPEHQIYLDGFWIHQAEVTNQQFSLCVSAGDCTPPVVEPDVEYWYGDSDYANYPVVGVTWFQAQQYCEFIHARLPTEAEWEKTARGSEAKRYPWGDEAPTCDLLNFDNCLDPSEPDFVRTYNNGASFYEAMDMAGNVFEWVNDWFADAYYPQSPRTNPSGPIEGTEKVYRGGAYNTEKKDLSVIIRNSLKPEEHAANLGFRCVLVGDPTTTALIPNTGSAPSCQVLPVNREQFNQPTWTPIPVCGDPVISSSCILRRGQALVGITLNQTGCANNILQNIYANEIEMTCSDSESSGGHSYLCNSSNLAQGANILVNFCHVYDVVSITPECPAGYEYNSMSTFCEPMGSWLPDPPCPMGYAEVEDHCYPAIPGDSSGSCPEEFYRLVFGAYSICIPLDECLLPIPPETCDQPVCSEGEIYDLENQCCSTPEELRQVCPLGFAYGEQNNVCFLGNIFPQNCNAISVKIPYCPTLTPTPTPTLPPPVQIDCSQFSESECEAHGDVCFWRWKPVIAARIGECVNR